MWLCLMIIAVDFNAHNKTLGFRCKKLQSLSCACESLNASIIAASNTSLYKKIYYSTTTEVSFKFVCLYKFYDPTTPFSHS